MNQVERLLESFKTVLRDSWDPGLAGPQKVWLAIYDPPEERRLRLRIPYFAEATKQAGFEWKLIDLTDVFAEWMAQQEYREAYFESPEDLDIALADSFVKYVAGKVRDELAAVGVTDHTLVVIEGIASLFGLMRVSHLLEQVAPAIRGRLLVFFPGQRDGSNYRLLDARDGWNYLARPITAAEVK